MVDEQLVRQAMREAVQAAVPGITCHSWPVVLSGPDQSAALGLFISGVPRYAFVHGAEGTVSRLSSNQGGVNTRSFQYEIVFLRALNHDGSGYEEIRADAGAFLDYIESKPLNEIFDPLLLGGGIRLEREYQIKHDRALVEHLGLMERITVTLTLSWRARRAS